MKIKLAVFILSALFCLSCAKERDPGCVTGAFLADRPTAKDIALFRDYFGKKPYLVMVFIDWEKFPDEKNIADIYSQGSVLFLTWEPWCAESKQAVDYDGLLAGKYDKYITDFAQRLKNINKTVFIRFAHEPNGDWYPWAGVKIGAKKIIAMQRYLKEAFDKIGCSNVKWVFCVNWEDVPKENNDFMKYYPGNRYIDYCGIDGYNWGSTQNRSRWMSFRQIFAAAYNRLCVETAKPILICEFASASAGGDKARWIKEALRDIKAMKEIRGFVLFDVDKEADWAISPQSAAGEQLKKGLSSAYFKDSWYE